jgi:Peptidase M61 N-terminal domain
MRRWLERRFSPVYLLCLVGFVPPAAAAQAPAPIVYTVKLPTPETHYAEVVAEYPTGGQQTIELMMPIWSPGYSSNRLGVLTTSTWSCRPNGPSR